MFLFAYDNKLRQFCNAIADSKKFDNFILLMIFISSILLAIENPLTHGINET